MTTLDTVIVALYFAAVAAFDLWFERRQRSTDDYFLAGR